MSGYCHDIRMAIFEVFEGDAGLEMTVSLDRNCFTQIIQKECLTAYNSEDFKLLTSEYLRSKVLIEIDSRCTSFEVFQIEFSEENIFVKGSLNLKTEKIKEVKLTNTCMIDFIEDHDNIMKLKLNDRTRSFRLNSKRTTTVASYKD